MRGILMVVILVLLFTGNAAANPNDCNLHQINATHWYFVTTQADLVYGTYNYQAFANNISSDYRELEYEVLPPQNLTAIPDINHIYLDWDNMSNSDNYSVYQDDVFLLNVTASNYNISGLSSSTEYTFAITAWVGSAESSKTPIIVSTTSATSLVSPSSVSSSVARGLISSDNETLIIGDSDAKFIINIAGLFNIIFDKTNPNNLITKILNSIQVHSPGTPQEISTFWTIVLLFGIILLISGVLDKNPKIQPVPAALFGFFISVISVFYLGLFSIVI